MKIRKAIGAVVVQDNEYLLIHKVRNSDSSEFINGYWDFPKGGVEESDKNLEVAVMRELKEETGSANYRIIDRFDRNICFLFPKAYKYEKQETTMFYVEYYGNREELKPQDEEIDEVKFFSKEHLMSIISLDETKDFLREVFYRI
ncbi:NUDIX hydrolase [Clostridium sp. C8-1-8]|uniref:NUDIX domain-containing protein n=1 Tax=Clostridium sp. C8-1-8 TaxID=2698831 RepID=UPI00136C28FD|nr:NUDIX hydrolase [Clostridium sp. C8-1-8]